MKKIVVLFKIVKDYEKVLPRDWQEEVLPAFDYVPNIFNVYDEAALEMALRIKDTNEVHLSALTLGEIGDYEATSLYAVGYDEVISLENNEEKVDIASSLIENNIVKYDLIMTGLVENLWESGTLPYELAHKLDRKLFKAVSSLDQIDINEQAVVSIGETDIVGLRMATLRNRKLAQEKVVIRQNIKAVIDDKYTDYHEIPFIRKRELLHTYKDNLQEAVKEIVKAISEVER